MMLQTLCQRGAGDVCTQCGEVVPPRTHRTCPAKRPNDAARESRIQRLQATNWLKRELAQSVDYRCAFLGLATGNQHKTSCSGGKRLDEHLCYHASRQRVSRQQNFAVIDGKCTPAGTCQDATLGIQSCHRCPLWQPRLLLQSDDCNWRPR